MAAGHFVEGAMLFEFGDGKSPCASLMVSLGELERAIEMLRLDSRHPA